MASKKSTPKLKKKSKNKSNELDETDVSFVARDVHPVAEGAVGRGGSNHGAKRNELPSGSHHSTKRNEQSPGNHQVSLEGNANLPKLPEKAKDPEKKKSKFWSFMTKKKMLLPKCSEVKEEQDEEEEETCAAEIKPQCSGHNVAGILYRASLQSNGSTASPVPSTAFQARRLSMGAGAGPTGLSSTVSPIRQQLLQLVPPSVPTLNCLPDLGQGTATGTVENGVDAAQCQQMRDVDMGVVISSNPIGYPHLCFSRSMSNSSSGSSSSSGASSVTEHSVTHGLVSTIYPQIDVIVPGARLHGALPSLPTSSSTSPAGLVGREPGDKNNCQGSSGLSSVSLHTVHTQVDYMHYLVPDLLQLTNCSFYWGVMDRYEAERLLENRPEGTFLVRDSAQEEFLFSVSFRRYGRSLHARIEQWNHKFSFDSHDLGVFASNSVCGLIEHYKDPNCCMFFEPMLTLPLSRTFCFSLQHLCRAAICSCVTYDSISDLQLPKCLREYLKYYHYKQRICVRRFETH